MNRPTVESPDLHEHGARGQTLNRRLYMQMLVMRGKADPASLIRVLEQEAIPGALYEQLHDPAGLGLLSFHEDPAWFLDHLRPLLRRETFNALELDLRFSFLGRSYSLGYEADLEQTLLQRPIDTILNPDWPWVIWYPLRRSGAFAQLPADKQRAILAEHGRIGMAFGQADLAHDVRLACHGLDRDDNDFLIGLTGGQLHPLSAIVQRMRQTEQTSLYLEKLGPFFVGRAIWKAKRS